MKNLYILFTLAFSLPLLCLAQHSSAPCDASDSIKAIYQYDADMMALKQTLRQGTIWKDSITINPSLSARNLKALISVYNATALAARDTVINLNVSNFPSSFSMNLMRLAVDTSESWINEWEKGNYTSTGYAYIDSLALKYGLSTEPFRTLFMDTAHIVEVVTDNFNLFAFSEAMLIADGVVFAYPGIIYGQRDSISARFANDTAWLTYTYGWNIPVNFKCPAGCPYRRFWEFKVNLSNCSVQYLGSYGDVLPQNIMGQEEVFSESRQVYPNPFDNTIYLDDVPLGSPYKIYTYHGQLVRQGVLREGQISNLQDLPAGVYLLRLGGESKVQSHRLLKE